MSPSDLPIEVALDRAAGARREEAEELLQLFREVSGEEPVVWAGKMLGFGEYHYQYASGHSGRAPLLAFATGPSKHTVYLNSDFATRWSDLVDNLGPHTASKACLYITRLSRVDLTVLRAILERSLTETRAEQA